MNSFRFDDAIEGIRMSPIVSISEEAKHKEPEFFNRTGKKMVLFQRGEIDFPTPKYIVDAAMMALELGKTKYPKSGGEDELKDAVIKKLSYFNRAEGFSRDNVVCTYGGQEGLELLFKLFQCKKGAGFAPCWSCVLENFVPYAQTDFAEVPLREDFTIDFDELERIIRDSSFFYLNTPQNPTGKLFTEDEVIRIAELCHKHGVFLISDEAYETITFDGHRHFSPLSLKFDNIISVFTLSKTYSMTGWRVGYAVSRNKRIIELLRLGNYTQTAGVTTFVQYAAKEALSNHAESDRHIKLMNEEFCRRRDSLYEGLSSIPGIKVNMPSGAFYLFPDFGDLIPQKLSLNDRKLYIYHRLLDNGVVSVYGACFGKFFNDHIRLSYSATPHDVIEEGINRIKNAVQ
ncbi:MAG: aminotransferase class I/II-fold pyridoxal phosphate-dependent enzyme [Bacteroidota bacterium]|nr:aminotransferase class I/II-fold pyridoxal phosphate-dependent enzyme [Bacteroidota bacterium]